MNKKKKGSLSPYGYLLPCMLIFAVFLFYPFFKTIYLSFYKTDKMGQAKLFVGLDNYTELLSSPSFSEQLKSNFDFRRNCCGGKYAFRINHRSAL